MNSQIDKKISDIVNKLVLEIELVKKQAKNRENKQT